VNCRGLAKKNAPPAPPAHNRDGKKKIYLYLACFIPRGFSCRNQTPDARDLGSGPSEISGGSGFADDPPARTHHQGWPRAKLSARFSASVRRAIRSSIWGRLHRANNRANRHALSEHVFLMRMLWIEGFTPHTTCSIPGRNRVDRDFLFDRVVITTERSDARAVFGHAVSLRVRCGCCVSRLVRL